jgi:predicted nucleic acid-binding protein
MVLVDTSVWIRFLNGSEPYAGQLDVLLERGLAAGHELVYGELLMGSGSKRANLLDEFKWLPQIKSANHEMVVRHISVLKLSGRGIGWIDAHLLTSTVQNGSLLWTASLKLNLIADEIGVAYSFSA